MTKNLSWNEKWNAGAQITSSGYIVEIELPLKIFGKPESQTWRIAFARENSATPEYSCWPGMRGSFHEPDKYAILNGVKVDKSCFLFNIDNAQFVFQSSNGGVVEGKVKLDLRSQEKVKQAQLALTISSPNGFNIKKRRMISLSKGLNTLTIPVTFLTEGTYTGKVDISTSQNNVKHNWKFNVKKNPFIAELIFPRYRNMIMDSMPGVIKISIKVKTKNVIGKKYHLELLDSKGNQVGQQLSLKFTKGVKVVQFKLPQKMKYGQYKLAIKYKDLEQFINLKKVSPIKGQPEVYFDEYNNMVINGKKTFPLGFYYGYPDVKNYIASGYNMTVDSRPKLPKSDEDGKIYSIAKARQIVDTLLNSKKQNKLSSYVVKQAQVQLSRKWPNVIGWYVADEPELKCKNNTVYRSALKKLIELSPRLPLLTTHNAFYGLKLDADLADIISMDPYLGFERNKKDPLVPYNRISAYIDDAVKSVNNRKPVWAILQCYPSGYYSGNPKNTRFPTIQEIRTMTYLAIVHGAKGVIYWYNASLNARRLWPAMKLFGKELMLLWPFFFAPDKYGCRKNGSVHYITKIADGKVCIIAVNTKGEKVKTTINSNSNNGTYNVLSENRAVRVVNGKLTDVFQPYSTHVYCSFKTSSYEFAKVLKNYSLEDSSIGISGADNLANFWHGAIPSPSSTNRYRKSCEAIDGSFYSDWVSYKDNKPCYEVKLYKKGHINKIIFSSDNDFNKLEVFSNNKWEKIKPVSIKKYYLYWDDDCNKWKTAVNAPGNFKPVRCFEIIADCPNAEKVRLWGAKTIRELQVFE